MRARHKIADLGAPFIRPGARVLTHGNSRVVLALLRRAVAQVPCLEPLCCMIPEYLNNSVARCSGRGLVGASAITGLSVAPALPALKQLYSRFSRSLITLKTFFT